MQEIGSDTHYRIAVDKVKNRAYFWFLGDMLNTEGTKRVVEDTLAACQALSPHFTVLADFTALESVRLT